MPEQEAVMKDISQVWFLNQGALIISCKMARG